MKMNKTVGIITHNFPLKEDERKDAGGFILEIAKKLNEHVRVVVLAPSHQETIEIIDGVMVQRFKWLSAKKLGDLKLWKLQDIKLLWNFFRQGLKSLDNFQQTNNLDVCISMWAIPGGFFAKQLYNRFKTPYVVWLLGSDFYVYGQLPIAKVILLGILKKASVLFADGMDLCRQVKQFANQECIFLPSVSGFKSVNAHSPNKSKITLTFLGRMEQVKGPDIFLDALVILKDSLSNYRINFIGDGRLLNKLKAKSIQENLDDVITFTGNIDDKDRLQEIIKSSNWVVIPSRSDSIPLVFSESMKSKTPVIASDLPDLKFLINKYNVGYTFKMGDSNDLASILGLLTTKSADEIKFSKNTANLDDLFDINTTVKTLVQTINQINLK